MIDFGRGGRAAILAGFALLLFAGGAALVLARSSEERARAASHSRQVGEAQRRLFSAVQDAETGQRGYLLTDDRSYLAPFERARERLPGLKADLTRLVADNPRQRQALAVLSADIDRKMRELTQTVTLQTAGDAVGALAIVKTREGHDLMLRIRSESQAFDEAERRTFEASRADAALQRSAVMDAIAAALVIVALLAAIVWLQMRRYVAELSRRYAALERESAERRRAEAQLRQSQKMEALGQLTGGIAHDFNNMLTIIIGNLEMMIRRLSVGDERVRTMAENALAGAARAASLTKRLLAFSRQQALDPHTTDVNRCVADMSDMLRGTLGENIAVETILAADLWRAFIDRPQLESAILNLAVNARDAMPDGGHLALETANANLDRNYAAEEAEVEPGQYVMIAVTDTGMGMNAEVVSRAIDPFFTTKKAGEGTGLGLSQVHGFIKQSRGHMKIYSESGVGTTVKLYLPRDREGLPETTRVGDIQVARDKAHVKVLIVEDEPGVRNFTVNAARELGFTVLEADGAAAAIDRLREEPDICILLTDVVMPRITGRQLADQALSLRPGLPIVFMTGYTRNAIVHNGALDHGVQLITKPFTLVELEQALSAALLAADCDAAAT